MMREQMTVKREADESDSIEHEHFNGTSSNMTPPSKRPKFERTFVLSWLERYSWLRYDSAKNVMFCELCLKQKKSNAFTDGCQNFRRDNLNKHVNTNDHRAADEEEMLTRSMHTGIVPHTLGTAECDEKKEELPITPNYIANPPFPYMNQTGHQSQLKGSANDGPVNLSVNHVNHRQQTPSPGPDTPSPSPHPATAADDELVLKVRVANAAEKDFIEIELDKNRLTFETLVSTMCKELEVNRKLVQKIRKLPDTILRKDKDVCRLKDFQELEVVLTSRAVSQSSRSYGLAPKDVDVVY